MNSLKYTYEGEMVEVTWDGRLCIHIAECSQANGELFIAGRQPWCQPDLSSIADIIEIVERCPSGALSFSTKSGTPGQQAKQKNSVMVSYNGPYFLSGTLEIEDATDDMPSVKFRAALCRCGHSKNKPFCDGSHNRIEFKSN